MVGSENLRSAACEHNECTIQAVGKFSHPNWRNDIFTKEKKWRNEKRSTSSKWVSLKCFFPISYLLTLSKPLPSVSTNLCAKENKDKHLSKIVSI